MTRTRGLKKEDYETLCKWWDENRFPPPPRDFLPNNGLNGIMVEDENGTEICAGFIYETSAKALVWVEYIVANFQVKDRELRKKALRYLISSLMEICRQMGKKYIYTSLKNESLVKHFKACGFTAGFSNTTEMVYSMRS